MIFQAAPRIVSRTERYSVYSRDAKAEIPQWREAAARVGGL